MGCWEANWLASWLASWQAGKLGINQMLWWRDWTGLGTNMQQFLPVTAQPPPFRRGLKTFSLKPGQMRNE